MVDEFLAPRPPRPTTPTAHRSPDRDPGGRGRTWAIVLAGGEGVRLRPLVRQITGDERPKQYVALLDSRSLLRQTLDRTGRLIPAERTVIVSQQRHTGYLKDALAGIAGPTVLLQPGDRGTGAGVLLPARWIYRRDPDAIVAVFPSDHFILEEAAFMAHTAEVVAFARQHSEWLVLLGAQPSEPEAGYGWIKPGLEVHRTGSGPICRAGKFQEKPDVHTAAAYLSEGWLWNTFVFVAHVSTVMEAGQELLGSVSDRLVRAEAFVGTELEP
jgi:mannose-1-phosphate guanylyltransferase